METLNKLIDKKITNVIAGGSNGSIVILDIGADEYSFFIYCSWRLSLDKKTIATSNDNNDPVSGNLTLQVKKLISDKIKSIDWNTFYDVSIEFYSGMRIDIFADVNVDASITEYDENWSLGDKQNNICYNINEKLQIKTTTYF